jgi:DNA-binding NarL/FixJ family response regulator
VRKENLVRREQVDVFETLKLALRKSESRFAPERQPRAEVIVIAIARRFSLSSQEANVLLAASRGETKKEIAYALGITVRTVEYYWTQIFKKLSCGSQIAVMALLFRCATDA